MRRTLEVFFRQPLRLVALVVLLPLFAVAIEYKTVAKTYQSSASLWALHRYVIIGATGPESDLTSTPAATQQAALSELLQTQAFAQKVANSTNLSSVLGLSKAQLADPVFVANAEQQALHSVVVTAVGYNLYTISWSSSTPLMAKRVVQAVITTFANQTQSFTTEEAQQLLGTYQTQLAQAQQTADGLTQQETRYIAAHPQLSQADLAADPQYAQLQVQTQQAQAAVTQIQNTIAAIDDEIAAQGSNSNGLLQVVDQPSAGVAQSRTKSYLVGGIVGLVLGLLASAVYLIIVVRRDTAIYSDTDLADVAPPILLQLPGLRVSPKHLPALVRGSVEPLSAEA